MLSAATNVDREIRKHAGCFVYKKNVTERKYNYGTLLLIGNRITDGCLPRAFTNIQTYVRPERNINYRRPP